MGTPCCFQNLGLLLTRTGPHSSSPVDEVRTYQTGRPADVAETTGTYCHEGWCQKGRCSGPTITTMGANQSSTTQKAFKPENSRISEATLEQWRNATVTGDLSQVPGISDATITALGRHNITSSFELMGYFLMQLGPNITVLEACNECKAMLEECGTPASHRDAVVVGIGEKLASGLQVEGIEMDETRLRSSQMSHQDVESFLERELTGDLEVDFKGVGKVSKTAMANHEVKSTWQLFGFMLMCGNTDDFEKWLREVGVAKGWTATVTHQCVEKLAHGLTLPQ